MRRRAQSLSGGSPGLAPSTGRSICASKGYLFTTSGSWTVQAASALEHLGDSFASEDPLAAVDFYERSLEGVRLGRGTTCTQHVKMAELLLKEPTPSNVERAADLLARWPDETQLPFPNAHFRWNLAVVELAQTVGDRKAAQEAARRALDLAGRGPVFPRHNTVGIVQTDRRTLKRLARLAK
jgi:hypothetical protein